MPVVEPRVAAPDPRPAWEPAPQPGRPGTALRWRDPSAWVAPLVCVAALIGYWLVYQLHLTAGPPVRSDGEGYYAYLPSYLVYFDDSFVGVVVHHFQTLYGGLYPPSWFGLNLQPTGHYLDSYPIGEALLVLPFFLIGHAIAVAAGLNANGYSAPEMYASGTAAAIYGALGIAALRAVLRRWFSPGVTLATLLVIVLGTGLYHYMTYDALFSHAYSFALMAGALLCALRWYERPRSLGRAALLGACCGLVVSVRIPDAVMLLAIPLLGVGSMAALRQRLRLLRSHARPAAVALGCAVVALLPQEATWLLATHHLIASTYPGQSFDFLHPLMLQTMVWLFPHGLLPYAPALGLAFIGLGIAWVTRRDLAVPVTLVFLLYWYMAASWWDWSFSAGFGDRIFVNVLPLLALPLAVFFSALRHRALQVGAGLVTAGLVGATCLLMAAYWEGKLGVAGAGAAGYFHILLAPLRLLVSH